MTDEGRTHVVTAFLRNRGEVLLVRRSDAVGTYPGRWGGLSGYVEGDPGDALADARREVREETGIDDATLVRAGEPLDVDDEGTAARWTVYPFLFDARTREVDSNYELAEHEWVPPPAILERETVPGLWAAYRRVGPTVETVREDRTHGSAYLSVRALAALRDEAATADEWESIAATARDLRAARPDMAAVRNRVARVVSEAGRVPDTVRERTQTAIEAALAADGRAAERAAALLDSDATVLTLSRSGTALEALRRAEPAVVVAESRPGREGVAVAERLADEGLSVALTTEAAIAHAIDDLDADAALVGADAVLPDGSVVNKVGTRLLGLAAAESSIPLYAVAARDKVTPDRGFDPGAAERADRADVYGGEDDRIDVLTPLFERTSAALVDAVVTEDGRLDADGIAAVAADHEANAAWVDDLDE